MYASSHIYVYVYVWEALKYHTTHASLPRIRLRASFGHLDEAAPICDPDVGKCPSGDEYTQAQKENPFAFGARCSLNSDKKLCFSDKKQCFLKTHFLFEPARRLGWQIVRKTEPACMLLLGGPKINHMLRTFRWGKQMKQVSKVKWLWPRTTKHTSHNYM